MGQNDENHEVYNNLTESIDTRKSNQKAKWTVYLALCCITACMGSFNFGYNIGALNLPTPFVKDFYAHSYFQDYFNNQADHDVKYKANIDNLAKFQQTKQRLEQEKASNSKNDTLLEELKSLLNTFEDKSIKETNLTFEVNLENQIRELNKTSDELKKTEEMKNLKVEFLWTLTNVLFVLGGMIGAFVSKYVLEYFGRKKGIIFHYIFTILGAFCVILAHFVGSPILIIISRGLYGLQGGLMCGLIPTYLNEIAPAALRGSCGVINQLFITVGICFSQTIGFRQLLGTKELWYLILAFPLIPSLIGAIVLLVFFSETPKALLLTNKDEDSTRIVLQHLRNKSDVDQEIEEMIKESRANKCDEAVGFKELFTSAEFRWPLITSLTLQLTQQLSGINAIFFYSYGIFKGAGIEDFNIQYAIFATGFINVLCTILVVPLIEKLGRKPLLVYPMGLMIVDFICLTFCLFFIKNYKDTDPHNSMLTTLSFLSIVCIILFIMCFAVGLGPIPFIYATEVFKQEARGAALAACMTLNWIANLILTLSFEYLAKLLDEYVFLIFTVIVAIAVIIITKKVPETKNKSLDEITAYFSGKKMIEQDESTGKLMQASKV